MRRALAAVLAVSLAATTLLATPSLAAVGDFRVGSFEGVWCGFQARFDIDQKDTRGWVFYGHVLIGATGEYDELWVEQFDDNSLRMERTVAAAGNQVQWVDTNPPYFNVNQSVFMTWEGHGYGCNGVTNLVIPE